MAKNKQAGIELGLNQAETVSLELTNQFNQLALINLFSSINSINIWFQMTEIAINQNQPY